MSMIYSLLRVSPAELASYQENSELLEARLFSEEEDAAASHLDKAWDGIYCLLVGDSMANPAIDDESDSPFRAILFPGYSGQLVDAEQELGYGPAHYLTAEQVADASKQLAAVNLRERFEQADPAVLAECYPFDEAWTEDDFAYIASYFATLQEFFATAAANGEAVISWLG